MLEQIRIDEQSANHMYRSHGGFDSYYLECPLDAIEDVARGLRPESVVIFQWAYHVVKVGEKEWQLDGNLVLWRKCRAYAKELEEQGYFISQCFQGGYGYQRIKEVSL